MMRILHVSDLEMDKTLFFFEEAKRVALEQKVDAIFYTGDFIDGRSDIYPAFGQSQKEGEQAVSQRLASKLTAEQRKGLEIVAYLQQVGGVEGLKRLLPTLSDPEKKVQASVALRLYEENREVIESLEDRIGEVNSVIKEVRAEQEQKLVATLTNIAGKKYRAIDELFAATKRDGKQLPLFYVLGNHDPKLNGMLPHLQNVEEKPSLFRGLHIEGASGVHSYDNFGYPASMIPHFDQDPSAELEREAVKNGNDPKAVRKVLLSKSPTYQRLKDERIDVLLVHKGPGRLGQELDKDRPGYTTDYGGWGIGIEQLVKDKKPMVFCGHLQPGRCGMEKIDDAEFFGSRANTYWGTICNIDDSAKKVVFVQQVKYKA